MKNNSLSEHSWLVYRCWHLINANVSTTKRKFIYRVQNVSDYWFENIPLVVTNAGKGLIMRNTAINKDRAVAGSRPDFVIRDKKEKNCLLIGAAIPNKTNVRTRSRKDYEVS